MMKKIGLVFLIWMCLCPLLSQIPLQKLKLAYIERITRFVKWPFPEKSTFELVIFGENPFGSELYQVFENLEIQNKKVNIRICNRIIELGTPDLLFISFKEKKRLPDLIQQIENRPILIISDCENKFPKGTHINLIQEGKYLRYEIDVAAIEAAGLEISSLLLHSAKKVYR